MPRTLYYAVHQKHRKLVRNRKGDAVWNITVNDYTKILKKGCYVCDHKLTEKTSKEFYPRVLKGYYDSKSQNKDYFDSKSQNKDTEYIFSNTIVLCKPCAKMCRDTHPITLLKQLIDIGSKTNKSKLRYPDSHRNNTSAESYETFLKYLSDNDINVSIDKRKYSKICSNACEFCKRKDTKLNRNHARIKFDSKENSFITICSSCEALYRHSKYIKGNDSPHDKFLKLCVKTIGKNNIVEKHVQNDIFSKLSFETH